MSRKSAVKEQPEMFVEQPMETPIIEIEPKNAVAKVVHSQPRTLLDRLREVSNGKDVAVAREFLAMIRSEEDRTNDRAFDEKMLACQSEIPPVTRSSFNKHTKSHWAKLEKISRVADPIIRKHGFTLSYGMETSPLPDHYRVICDVSNSGRTRRYQADVGMDSKGPKGEGNKSLAQGSGSSITYARRYLKVMIFDIVIEGEDNDGAGSQVIEGEVIGKKVTPTQVAELAKAIGDCGVGVPRFLEKYGIDKVADLPAATFSAAMKACANFQKPKDE